MVLKLSTNQIKEIYLLNKNPKCEKKWNKFLIKNWNGKIFGIIHKNA